MILLFPSFFYVSTVVYDEDSFIRDDFEIRLESARRLLYFSVFTQLSKTCDDAKVYLCVDKQ